jgi:hypothetical protein
MNKPCARLGAVLCASVACAASAAPTIDSTQFFTDRWAPSVVFPTLSGDYLHLFTTVLSPDTPAQVSAVATQGALVRPLNFFTGPIFAEKNFERYLTNTALTGAWNLTATDTSGSSSGSFAAIADPEFLPLLQNVQAIGSGTMPTITWTVPDLTGFDVDDIRVRVVEAGTSSQIFQSALLPTSATSFTLPSGVLQPGASYVFRILLDDVAGQRLENRSNTFSDVYVAGIPEPQTYALMLAGLGALWTATRRRRA